LTLAGRPAVKLIAYTLAVLLDLLGLVFIIGAQGQWVRVVVGVVLFGASGALLVLTRMRPAESTTTVVQKIDLTGDVRLKDLKCRSCGGTLTEKSLEVKAGAVFIHCEYCGAAYQLEEDPTW
jgi:hypothetical protein